jgi:hypothetical protein
MSEPSYDEMKEILWDDHEDYKYIEKPVGPNFINRFFIELAMIHSGNFYGREVLLNIKMKVQKILKLFEFTPSKS